MCCVEFLIELSNSLQSFCHLIGWSNQVCDSGVVVPFFLSESASRDCNDTCSSEQFHAIHEVCLNTLFLSLSQSFLRELNFWEGIHSALDRSAGDVVHLVEFVGEEKSSFLESVEDSVVLSEVLLNSLVGLLASLWRINFESHADLPHCVSAQLDALAL